MTTIRDISEYTDLSVGTVSKYLNGGKIRPENRVILDEAVAKLHYRMNFAARTLRRQRSNTIGVVLPLSYLSGMSEMLNALDQTLLLNGYSMILCAYADDTSERDKIKLLGGNTDGLIILPSSIEAAEIAFLCKGIPVVALDCAFPESAFDSVLTDYFGSAYLAAEYLLSRKHSRIGAIWGGQNAYVISELKAGYLRALSDFHQTPDNDLLLEGECSFARGYELFLRLGANDNPPSAILVTNEKMLMGAQAAANEKGLRLMQDIDIIGFSYPGMYKIPGRQTPIIELSENLVGVAATELLLERLGGKTHTQPMVRRIKSELRFGF